MAEPTKMGRPPGTRNRAIQEILDKLEEASPGFNLFAEYITIYKSASTTTDQKLTILREIGKKTVPDLRAIEHSGEIGARVGGVLRVTAATEAEWTAAAAAHTAKMAAVEAGED